MTRKSVVCSKTNMLNRMFGKLCISSKTCCGFETVSTNMKFSISGLDKRILDQSSEKLQEKCRLVLDDAVQMIATYRGLPTMHYIVNK